MHYIRVIASAFALAGIVVADAGLAQAQAYCPACVGNKYTDPVTQTDGCCPLGYHFQGCVKDPPQWCNGYTGKTSCPEADGQVYITNGLYFQIECKRSTWTAPSKTSVEKSLLGCADTCSKTPSCKGAEWVIADGGCWTRTNSGLGTLSVPRAEVDQVDIVSGCPAPPIPSTTNPTCPADDGKQYTNNGKTYKVTCGFTTMNGDLGSAPSTSPKECADACTTRPTCKAGTFYNGQCWWSTLGMTPSAAPLAGSVVLAQVKSPKCSVSPCS